tara:strand:- start:18 stop:2243 length:2226 start_codon:yes stop_codon:yes gene_type:complete
MGNAAQTNSNIAGGLTGTPDIDVGTGSFTGDVDIADKIVHTGDTNTAIRFPAADTFTVETSGSERIRVNSSGKVLIGVTNSYASASADDLQIGDNTDSTQTGITLGSTAQSSIRFRDGADAGTIRYDHSDDSMRFATSDTEAVRITSSGNLGVGTASPSFKLSAAGGGISAQTSSNDGALVFLPLGASNENRIYSRSSVTGTGNKDLAFRIGDTEHLRIDSSGRILIGTTNAVAFGSRQVLAVANGTTGGVLSLYNSTTATANTRISSNPTGSEINDIGIHAASTNGSIQFYTNNDTEQMRIFASGHVVIGATSDTGFFRVSAADGASDDQYVGQFENLESTAGRSYGVNIRAGSNSTDHSLRIKNRANDETHLIVSGNGKMGLGTASPNSYNAAADNLVIYDSSNAGITIRSGTSSDGAIYFNDTDDANQRGIIRYVHASDALAFHTSAGESLRIDSSGRVLIGTTTEGHAEADNLTIADSGKAGITIRSGSSESGYIDFSDGTSGDDEYRGVVAYNHASNYMVFYSNAAERLRIASSGQWGLGGANYGSSGQVITSNGSGSAPTWQDAGGGAWNLITTVNASNATTADITGTSSTYNQYCIIGRGVYNQSSTGYVYARMIDNGTVISSTDYYNSWQISNTTTTTITGVNEQNASDFRVGRCGDISREYCDMYLFFNNTHAGSVQMNIVQGYSYGWNGSSAWRMQYGSGLYQTGMTNLSGIRIYSASGNINGTFQLYGIS